MKKSSIFFLILTAIFFIIAVIIFSKKYIFLFSKFEGKLYNKILSSKTDRNCNKIKSLNKYISNHKENYEIGRVVNPYSGNSLYWCSGESVFCQDNWPNTFDWDYDIKKHIIEHAIHLPQNSGIIDCGAHIGDGAIPIADALIKHGRSDIVIFAIDPSPNKCKYMEAMAKINNLSNIRVLQYGLSNKQDTYTHAFDSNRTKNTGRINWHSTSEVDKIAKNQETIKFIKLDTLVSNHVIDRSIGYIHFDVENMEPEAILGGMRLFAKDKPILSAETHTHQAIHNILDILSPLGYQFQEKINANSIFESKKKKNFGGFVVAV